MSRRQGPTRSLVFAPGVRAACRNTSVDLQERSRMPRDSTRGAPRAAHQSVRAVSGSTTGRAGKENQELQIDKPGREMRRTWPNRHGVGAASDRLMPDAKQRHANIRPQRIVGIGLDAESPRRHRSAARPRAANGGGPSKKAQTASAFEEGFEASSEDRD
ncbi:unnamed protein product [Prorocentrum cordatum]|uniref:Uncharacterized protein n=1 Tax=Prorocentrum cordatum TaxID=2364126 RepID=A0ABN9WWT8_9DINO|nr:unnamed protein product [Polarella glacialis]